MKKNVVLAIAISFFLILACVVVYYIYQGEKNGREGAKRAIDDLEKVQELTNDKNDYGDLSTLPDDSPLKVDTAWVEVE